MSETNPLEIMRKLDLFSVSIYPSHFKQKTLFGSIFGFIWTLTFIVINILAIIYYSGEFSQPKNANWTVGRTYNMTSQTVHEKDRSAFYRMENPTSQTFDGEDFQLYIKFSTFVEKLRPRDVSNTVLKYSLVDHPTNGCTDTTGWCKQSYYFEQNELNSKTDLFEFNSDSNAYEIFLDVRIFKSMDSMKIFLKDGTDKEKPMREHQVQIVNKYSYKKFFNNTYLPIFDKQNMTVQYNQGEVMMISVMIDNNFYKSHSLSFGFVSKLQYKQHQYDYLSNKSFDKKNFAKRLADVPNGASEQIWGRLGFSQDYRQFYPEVVIGEEPYKAAPIRDDYYRILTFGYKSYFLNNNGMAFAKTTPSEIANIIQVNEFSHMKYKDKKLYLKQRKSQPDWERTGQFFLDKEKATLAQYILEFSGEKQNIYAQYPETLIGLHTVTLGFIYLALVFFAIGQCVNKILLNREIKIENGPNYIAMMKLRPIDYYDRKQREKGQVRESEDAFGTALPVTTEKSHPNRSQFGSQSHLSQQNSPTISRGTRKNTVNSMNKSRRNSKMKSYNVNDLKL